MKAKSLSSRPTYLRRRISVALWSLGTLSALALAAYMVYQQHGQRQDRLHQQADSAASEVRTALATMVQEADLESALQKLVSQSDFALGCVYRANGQLTATAAIDVESCPTLGRPISGLQMVYAEGLSQEGVNAVFYYRAADLSEPLRRDVWQAITALALLALLLVPVSQRLGRRLTAPLRQLAAELATSDANAIASSAAQHVELAELASAFQHMAAELERTKRDARDQAHRRDADQLTERVALQTLREIIDLMPFYVFTQRTDGSLVYANQATADLFGLSLEEMLDPSALYTVRQSADGAALLQVSDHQSLPSYNQEIWLQGLGKPRRLKVSRVLFSNNKHQLVTAIDVTEEHRLQTQLQFSQRLEVVGTLAGGIAHDFNNLLTPIIGYTSLLRRHEFDPETHTKLNAIATAAEKARQVVKQILAFSRQQPDTEHQPTDVNEVVESVVDLMRISIPSNVRLNISRGEVQLANVDQTKLEQVLVNLCTNAAQAIGNGHGVITIETTQVSTSSLQKRYLRDFQLPEYISIRVHDTGHGMSADVLEHIFEPFYTTKEVGRGTGLGLSVAHGIVQSHRGEILVTSEPSQGSCFEIILPLSGMQVELPVLHQPQDRYSARIMVVDDEAAVLRVTSELLGTLGHQATPFKDPQSALNAFRETPAGFDLLLTDERMPNMTGTELARAFRSIDPHFPVLMMTGYSEDDFDTDCVDDRLLKPMTGQSLNEKIELLMRATRSAA